MVAPSSYGLSEVGDVEVVPHREEIHLFHLTLPNHDVVQHAVSRDGLNWTALPPALHTGNPGDCDDDMLWTMSVTERPERYYMLYTALACAEGGRVQRTALATSDDLMTWTKHPDNPVGEADPRWYEAEVRESGRVSWRDPKPILVGNTYYATICAREKTGPLLRRGCVGLLASPDLIYWQVQPPLFAPRLYYDLECPQVFRLNGRYYLTAAIMEDRTQRYWVADDFQGPYRTPPQGNLLAPIGHYAGRICHWQGNSLYFCWHFAENDWPGVRNPNSRFIAPPLVVAPEGDGRLRCSPYPGWKACETGPSALLSAEGSVLSCNTEGARAVAHWSLNVPCGFDILASPRAFDDFRLEGILTIDAAAGGLAFRLDEQATGYFVRLVPGTAEVILTKWLPTQRPWEPAPFPWFKYVQVRRGTLTQPLVRGHAVPFSLLVVGPYIELSLHNEVVIAAMTFERARGQLGIWGESGSVALRDARVTLVRRPVYH